MQALREVVESEPEKGDWWVLACASRAQSHTEGTGLEGRGFKALKQITKIRFLQLKQPDAALESYRELLTYTQVRGVSCPPPPPDDADCQRVSSTRRTDRRHTQRL